jgi:hypothetical protein
MSMTKTQLVVAGVLLGGAAVIVVCQQHSQTALRRENEALRQNLAQLSLQNESLSNDLARISSASISKFSAAPKPDSNAPQSLRESPSTNLITTLVHGGEVPPLTPAQLTRYLEDNHRSSASLLAAYRTSGDRALLDEAMEKYAGDPEVAFEAALRKDITPAERAQWLEAFKKAAPENPLPNYLSAVDYFKSGQTGQAVQELLTASSRQGFADYTLERIQADTEAYRSAGYSEAEAKMAAAWGVTLPQLIQLKTLAQNSVELARSYGQGGDANSSQAMLQAAIGLGQQLDASSANGVPMVTRLVGIAIERMALSAMDPSTAYGDGTVQQQLDQLVQRRSSMQNLVKQLAPFQDQMTSEDWLTYNERTLGFGEENAIGWLLTKYGQK